MGFEALPHRMNFVATKHGVRYIDDSKATNPHATLAALTGLSDVVLIAGGRAKGLPLSLLTEAIPAIKGVVVMGEAAEGLRRVFDGLPLRRAENMADAVAHAAKMALAGDLFADEVRRL